MGDDVKNCGVGQQMVKGFGFIVYIQMVKVSLQNWLQHQATTLLNKINITSYFENLTIELHVLYAFNTHVKFCVNWILFTI